MEKINHLKQLFNQSQAIERKYQIARQISVFAERNLPKTAVQFAEKTYRLALQLGDKIKQVDALIIHANILKNISQYDKALSLLAQAEYPAKSIKYKVGAGLILSVKGFIAYRQGRVEGEELCQKALKTLQKAKYRPGIAKAYTNLSAVYFGQGHFDKAIVQASKGQDLYLDLGDDFNGVVAFFNLVASFFSSEKYDIALPMITEGIHRSQKAMNREIEANFYNLRGAYYYYTGAYKEAAIAWEKTLDIRTVMNSWDYAGMSAANLSSAFLGDKNVEKALKTNALVLELIPKINSPHVLTTIQSVFGNTAIHLKDYTTALKHHQTALMYAEKSNNIEHQRQSAKAISLMYEELKDFENALRFYKKFKALHDEIFRIEKERIIVEWQEKLNVQKKEALLEEEKARAAVLNNENRVIKNQKNNLEYTVKQLTERRYFETRNCGILSYDEIIYFAANGERTKIYTTNQEKPLIETQLLGDLQAKLPEDEFFRVHKSYIINGHFLTRKNSKKYFLKNGFEINVSRTYKPNLSNFLNQK